VCGSSADAFRGFTLIEVLVAFSILAMSLGVLFQIFATGLRGTRLAEEYSHAVLLAESELARLRIQPSAAAAAALGEGEVEVDARYDQTVSVEAITDASLTAIAATTLRPYRVTVEMSWGEGSHRRSVPLTTVMLYRTPPGEGP
jgi:general secretion pathway protein I